METDLYGEEMSSVRQRTDERNSRERRQKQTKACTQLHSCRKWKGKKKRIQSFLCVLPRRGHLTWWKRSDVCKVLLSLLWWFTRSKHNYNQREYLYLRGAQLRLTRSGIAFLFELWLVWRSNSATPSVRCRWRGSSCASIKCSLFLPCYHMMGVADSGLKTHEVEQATWIIDWQSYHHPNS